MRLVLPTESHLHAEHLFTQGRQKMSILLYQCSASIRRAVVAALVTQARGQPLLFVDPDILWFRDPALLLDDPVSWNKPRALRESNCHQSRDMALRHCPQALEAPFVNSGIVAYMLNEGYHSRHYVNWMRHLFYHDLSADRHLAALILSTSAELRSSMPR